MIDHIPVARAGDFLIVGYNTYRLSEIIHTSFIRTNENNYKLEIYMAPDKTVCAFYIPKDSDMNSAVYLQKIDSIKNRFIGDIAKIFEGK